jgi:hypothetical protein
VKKVLDRWGVNAVYSCLVAAGTKRRDEKSPSEFRGGEKTPERKNKKVLDGKTKTR